MYYAVTNANGKTIEVVSTTAAAEESVAHYNTNGNYFGFGHTYRPATVAEYVAYANGE